MSYYNSKYFQWQQKAGELAGKANLFFYKSFIGINDNVLDFGCGGGYLLSQIQCKSKLGIEINEEARKHASMNGVKTMEKTYHCSNDWADVIISCHALEHTFDPLSELKNLYPKLKVNGKIIFVVPYERKVHYKPNDVNQHLFTWSEMNLANLFTCAGYKVLQVKEFHHRFLPSSAFIMKYFGIKGFHFVSRIYGFFSRDITQIRVIAAK
ncbi:MAG TPA: class I SAM-dependent methyltransferase [Flavisolibacter sp.]|nr:class I SAM-dependent methyltransferase [Flavisolibacter sp.]